ncbi:MAG: hypothetical protein IKC28_09340 [Clostridia bacterium]|nr:hypothetical protein [Clostridia bacterium]
MENNNYMPAQEEITIDLKEMFFCVLRKWKIILALVLIGAIVGGLFATTKTASETTTTETSSVQSYLITSDFFTTDLINAKVSTLIHDDADLDALRQEFGIELENDEIRKMLTINVSKTATSPTAFADTSSGTKITLTVKSTDADENAAMCEAVAKAVDKQMENLNAAFAAEYENYHYEKLSENLETTTTTTATPAPSPVKYALIGAFLMGALAAAAFVVLFIFNPTIKTVDDLRTYYGQYPIAVLGEKRMGSLPANDQQYLLDALKAMQLDKPLFCGDMNNARIASTLEWLAGEDEQYAINPALAVGGQLQAVQAGSIILCVQLWKTTNTELKREMEICSKLNKKIAGVIVLQ